MAVRLSKAAIRSANLCRSPAGRQLPMTRKIPMPSTTGAKACKSIAAFQCPLANKTTALVRPHPGQITPSVDLTGHCHAIFSVAVNTACVAVRAASSTMIHRFCIKGPITAANNPLSMRAKFLESAVIESLNVLVKPPRRFINF